MVNSFKRIGIIIPYLIAIVFFSLLVFCVAFLRRLPFDGLEWSRVDGLVQSVHPWSPANGSILPGDVILTVDGVPASQAASIYSQKNAGDILNLSVDRDSKIFSYKLTLTSLPPSKFPHRFAPLLVAFSFWLIGALVQAFAHELQSTNLFFGLCMFGSGILASGAVSARGPEWTSSIFNILLWWIGPLAVHFHMYFPEQRSDRLRRILHVLLYAIAFVGSLPILVFGSTQLHASPLNRSIFSAGRFFLALNLVIVMIFIAFSYIHATRGGTRQQIRIITFGGGLSLLIVVVLTLLPSALILKPIVPYETGLMFLLLIPLSYGYNIIRYRLIKFERSLNRGAVYVLVFTLLIGFYVIIVALVERYLPGSLHNNVVLTIAIILLLAMSFEPLRKHLQHFMDWVFYGGWYDYRSAIANITEDFGQYTDSNRLGKTIVDRLKEILRLEFASLILISSQGAVFPIPKRGELPRDLFSDNEDMAPFSIPPSGELVQLLMKDDQVVEAREIKHHLKGKSTTATEFQLINALEGTWITPILGSGTLLGTLVLGPKIGREVFSREDLDILKLVSRHAGIALQNIQFLNELKHRTSEINQLHQEIIRAREEERKKLSHELHDKIIQALIGLNFDLGHFGPEETPRLRGEVRQIVSDLRQMCTELRPQTLDNLGLVPAVRSVLRAFESTNHHVPQISLQIEGDEEQFIPENIALNLFRVLNESLNNVLRHADAQHVEVAIRLDPKVISLRVKDDGCGFLVPQPLGKLLSDQHFGLVGMRERMEHLHGNLSIDSAPGNGTLVFASVPLDDPGQNPDNERMNPYE